jgi:uncharacterized protein YjbJ (UPF0337 family)
LSAKQKRLLVFNDAVVMTNEINRILVLIERQNRMDKDRIKGSVQQAKGTVKEVIGKVTGDAKLEAEGKDEQIVGKIQSAVGGLKDMLRGK